MSTWLREEGEAVHRAGLPVLLGCRATVFGSVLCFHGNFLPKNRGYLPYSSNTLITCFFALPIPPHLLPKASLGKPEQKVAGTSPVCPPRRAPSQKDGGPSLSSWHLMFSLERKRDHLPWTLSNGVCPHFLVPRTRDS